MWCCLRIDKTARMTGHTKTMILWTGLAKRYGFKRYSLAHQMDPLDLHFRACGQEAWSKLYFAIILFKESSVLRQIRRS